jgi:hypothetical protein
VTSNSSTPQIFSIGLKCPMIPLCPVMSLHDLSYYLPHVPPCPLMLSHFFLMSLMTPWCDHYVSITSPGVSIMSSFPQSISLCYTDPHVLWVHLNHILPRQGCPFPLPFSHSLVPCTLHIFYF